MPETENKKEFSFEKRRSMRKPSALQDTALVSNGSQYPCVIENMCEHGMHVIAASKENVKSFIPETIVELKIKSSADKQINLYCDIRWVHINKTPIHGLTYRMGMEIMKQSPEYGDFISSL
jgi:hypothetical protein